MDEASGASGASTEPPPTMDFEIPRARGGADRPQARDPPQREAKRSKGGGITSSELPRAQRVQISFQTRRSRVILFSNYLFQCS